MKKDDEKDEKTEKLEESVKSLVAENKQLKEAIATREAEDAKKKLEECKKAMIAEHGLTDAAEHVNTLLDSCKDETEVKKVCESFGNFSKKFVTTGFNFEKVTAPKHTDVDMGAFKNMSR